MAKSLRDAFYSSKDGRKIAYQAKRTVTIKSRIRVLKNLVHSTFVSDVPAGHARRWDIYQNSKPLVKKLGVQGGETYQQALDTLKFTWTSKKAYKEACEVLGC